MSGKQHGSVCGKSPFDNQHFIWNPSCSAKWWLLLFLALSIRLPAAAAPLNVQWAQAFGSSAADASYSVAAGPGGTLYVAGFFNSATITFGEFTLTNSNPGSVNNLFVARFTSTGETIWAKNAVGIGENSAYSLAVDKWGNAYIAGRYLSPTLTFDDITITNSGGALPIESFAAKFEPEGNVVWAKSGGGIGSDTGWAIATDGEGNAYVTGWFINGDATFDHVTLTNNGSFDLFVVKYGPSGDLIWAKNGGTGSDEQAKGIAVDASGNVYVTGRFDGATSWAGTAFNTAGSYDFLLLKFSPAGNVLWAQTYGGSELDYGSAVVVDSDQNVLVTGYYKSPSFLFGADLLTNSAAGTAELFTAKFDGQGQTLWVSSLHGTNEDEGRAIAVDAVGNAYVTGYHQSLTLPIGTTVLTNHGLNSADALVLKYDKGGKVVWGSNFGGTLRDFGRGIAVDTSGQVFVSGEFVGSATFGSTNLTSVGSVDAWLAKLAPVGPVPGPSLPPDFVWVRQAGGSSNEVSTRIAGDSGGNVYISGYTEGTLSFGITNLSTGGLTDTYLAKYDGSGNFLWARQFSGPGSDVPGALLTDSANNVYLAGYFSDTASIDGAAVVSAGNNDIFLLKLDSAGRVQWLKSAGGSGGDFCLGLAMDRNRHLILGGYFRTTAQFGTNQLTANPGCTGATVRSDAFVAKYDLHGEPIWVASGGGCHDDVVYAVDTDSSGNVFAAGYLRADATFGTTNLSSAGLDDAFVAKYSTNGTLLWIRKAGGSGADKATALAVDAVGNSYVSGFFESSSLAFGSTNLLNRGGLDIFVAKYDPAGNLLWARHAGGAGSDEPTSVLVDSAGTVFLSGRFEGVATFDGSTLTSRGSSDLFLARYGSNGVLHWVKQFGQTFPEAGGRMVFDWNGDLFITGNFQGSTLLGNSNLVSAGSSDIFVGRLSTDFIRDWPVLELAVSGNNLLITWPTTYPSHVLQQSQSLSAGWTDVGAGAVVIGDRKVIAIPMSGAHRFFRLLGQP